MIRYLLPVLLLGVFACAKAPAGASSPDADGFAYFYLDVYRPFFKRSKNALGEDIFETAFPLGRKKQSFDAKKAQTVYRVFLLGGSVAQLYDIGSQRPTLREALQASLPGKTVEVLNLGMSAYDAARAEVRFDEVLRYEPDLIVFMTGANESGRPLLSSRQAFLCGFSYLRDACESYVRWRMGAQKMSADEYRSGYARVLQSVAEKARRRGISLMFATLPVSVRDMPPRGVLPLDSGSFFSAWADWERGRWKKAVEGFRACLSLKEGARSYEREAFAHYYLARSLDKLGRYEEALEQYKKAQNNYRPLPMMNEAMRRIAKNENVALADIEKAFEDISPHRLPGRALFEDDVHWDRSLDPLATAVITEALSDRGGPWTSDWLKEHKDAVWENARALKMTRERSWYVFKVRMWEPLRSQEGLFSERVLSLLETVRLSNPQVLADADVMKSWLKKKLTGNIWMEDDEAKLDRWWPAMLAHVGELYRRQGRYARAAVFFDAALELSPDMRQARLYRALSYAAGGEKKRGREEIDRLPHWRGDPVVRHWMEELGL